VQRAKPTEILASPCNGKQDTEQLKGDCIAQRLRAQLCFLIAPVTRVF
jgi:hypothetical protein